MAVTTIRRAAGAVAAVAALLLVACGSEPSPAVERDMPVVRLDAKSGPELRKLVRQANQLLDGGPDAFNARLAELRGHPVVVNQWASWCGPCRFEFPFFQRLAGKYAGRVAFLGVNSQMSSSTARWGRAGGKGT